MAKLIAVLFAAVAMPFAAVPLLVLDGWYVATIWNWIAVPAFGAPVLTVAMGIGSSLIVSAHRYPRAEPKEATTTEGQRLVAHFLRYPLGLLIAYIVKGFI